MQVHLVLNIVRVRLIFLVGFDVKKGGHHLGGHKDVFSCSISYCGGDTCGWLVIVSVPVGCVLVDILVSDTVDYYRSQIAVDPRSLFCNVILDLDLG